MGKSEYPKIPIAPNDFLSLFPSFNELSPIKYDNTEIYKLSYRDFYQDFRVNTRYLLIGTSIVTITNRCGICPS